MRRYPKWGYRRVSDVLVVPILALMGTAQPRGKSSIPAYSPNVSIERYGDRFACLYHLAFGGLGGMAPTSAITQQIST